MPLLRSQLTVITNKNSKGEDAEVELDFKECGEAVLIVKKQEGLATSFALSECQVDLELNSSEGHDTFIARIGTVNFESGEMTEVDLFLQESAPPQLRECWKQCLSICTEFFEVYRVNVNSKGDWTLLAFYDRAVLVPKPRRERSNDVIVVISQINKVAECWTKESRLTIVCEDAMVIKYGWSESEGLTEMNREGETWKIGCEDELEHYPLKHYLQRFTDEDETFHASFLSRNDAEMYFDHEPIEETMILNNTDEHVYERDADFYCCSREEDGTFLHRRLGRGYGKLMCTLGYPEYGAESSSSTEVSFALPDVSYEHEWFWPHVTYQQAENLLNDRQENMVVIRMSQTKPGHFALTAAHGARGHKTFKHFHIKTVGDCKYKLGKKKELFTSYLEIIRYFVEVHNFRYLPYIAERKPEWRSSVSVRRNHPPFLSETHLPEQRCNSDTTNSEAPPKPPRTKRSINKDRRKNRTIKSKSMVTLRMPVLLTAQESV